MAKEILVNYQPFFPKPRRASLAHFDAAALTINNYHQCNIYQCGEVGDTLEKRDCVEI